MIAEIVNLIFVLALLAGVPALSMVTARRPQIREAPRRALYLSAAVSQWLLALSGVGVVLVTLVLVLPTGIVGAISLAARRLRERRAAP